MPSKQQSYNTTPRKITAGGRLGDQSIHHVNTAPNGTLALSIDRQSEEIPTQILIYYPKQQDVQFLTTDDGLQAADRIEMLDFAPAGRLVILAAGCLLRSTGPIADPPTVPWWRWALLVAAPLLLGIAAALVFLRRQSHKQLVAQYAGIMAIGERLFDALGQSARRVDYRTLELSQLPFAALGSSQRPVRLYAVLDTDVSVDQI